MASVRQRLITAEEFLNFPEPEDSSRLELVRGEVVCMTRPNWEHGEAQGNVYMLIKQYLKQHPIGRVAVESGVITERNPDTVRGPDVSFFSSDRLPIDDRAKHFIEGSPDLCVEILSPSNSKREIRTKLQEYFASGTRLAWLVDPQTRTVTVHQNADEGIVLNASDTLDGGDVLPGFACQVRELFD